MLIMGIAGGRIFIWNSSLPKIYNRIIIEKNINGMVISIKKVRKSSCMRI
jgi:hypothetical protein